jgi:hypothetical protein
MGSSYFKLVSLAVRITVWPEYGQSSWVQYKSCHCKFRQHKSTLFLSLRDINLRKWDTNFWVEARESIFTVRDPISFLIEWWIKNWRYELGSLFYARRRRGLNDVCR